MRFGKKRKLSPRYIGPYKILKRVGKVAYELEFLAELAVVHPDFHISSLKKFVGDPASIVLLESVDVKDNLTYEDVPVDILDRQDMNTQRVKARRIEGDNVNKEAYQVNQAPINPSDMEVRSDFQMLAQAMTTQAQAMTTQA
ncbi:uncharacterized protein LOC125845768 [Solanum stenotomum]|uniref:uncharacterized protein LOC125845768 n=1 Tax=Solanum stenotomum TaxID=172797 RepID=UPI0020D019E9|nr:uncharacterized protein LOC125845768 [Solanum stenotomum]